MHLRVITRKRKPRTVRAFSRCRLARSVRGTYSSTRRANDKKHYPKNLRVLVTDANRQPTPVDGFSKPHTERRARDARHARGDESHDAARAHRAGRLNPRHASSARGAMFERERMRSIEGANDRPSRPMTVATRAGRRAGRCADAHVAEGISGPRFRRVFWSGGHRRRVAIVMTLARAAEIRSRWMMVYARSLSPQHDNKLQIIYPSKTAKNGSFERTSSGAARGSPTATSVYKKCSSGPCS